MLNIKIPAITTAISALILGLTACGGGGSSGGAPATGGGDSASHLSGTAATGAPITGATLCLRQAGTAASEPCDLSTTTDEQGHYTLDATGLAAPYTLTLRGANAGGAPVVLRSGATKAPEEGQTLTVNVTPLTNSVVAAASDKPAGETGPDDLVDGTLEDAELALRTAIQDLITAVGTDTTISLLNGEMETNHTGLDLLLDLVDVTTVEQAGGAVTVTFTVKSEPDQKLVVDNGSGALGENSGESTLEDTGAIEDAAGMDLSGIKTLFSDFNAAVAGGAGSTALVEEYFGAGFLHGGESASDYASFAVEDHQRHGGDVLKGVQIAGCEAANAVCAVETTWVYQEGAPDPMTLPVKQMRDGSWVFYGDQRAHHFSLDPYAQRQVGLATGETITEYGIQLNLSPEDEWNTGIKSAVLFSVADDGTETEVMRFVQCDGSPSWLSHTADGECPGGAGTNMWALSEAEREAQRALNGNYHLQLYTDKASTVPADGGSYTDLALSAPLFADTGSVTFPALTGESQAALAELAMGDGTLPLAWSLGEGNFLSSAELYLADVSSRDSVEIDKEALGVLAEEAVFDFADAVTGFSGLDMALVRLSVRDSKNRGVFTVYH
ncbi:MAG: carboxypeptidase-like regulatory domain-containing protein [Pseudomonadota bacterium]|nr:carboxypeptidase-like regulatory domain-containing protein [Pseudomonadota bacterium]